MRVFLLPFSLIASATLATAGASAAPVARRPDTALPVARRPDTAPSLAAGVRYGRPVPGAVLRPFRPPPTPYSAGHRGVDLAAEPGAAVHAAAGGAVVFAGRVAGRGLVVVSHADGITTEYEPVRPLVRAGSRVALGQPIGTISGRHAGCAAGCLHWGARRAGRYVDPLALLGPLGPVVLLPWPRDG